MTSILERFWSKVDKNGPIVKPVLGPCWEWKGALDKDCYGRFNMSQFGLSQSYPAHKAAWLLSGYEIPNGLVLDHQCNFSACVRPTHMALVTSFRNNSRAHTGNKHWRQRKQEKTKRGEV